MAQRLMGDKRRAQRRQAVIDRPAGADFDVTPEKSMEPARRQVSSRSVSPWLWSPVSALTGSTVSVASVT
jgi:hypothetical protein